MTATATTTALGKAGGVGGSLLFMPDPAPLEIGNRVWSDTDSDGVQDPGEDGISGVTVRLYNSSQHVGRHGCNGRQRRILFRRLDCRGSEYTATISARSTAESLTIQITRSGLTSPQTTPAGDR